MSGAVRRFMRPAFKGNEIADGSLCQSGHLSDAGYQAIAGQIEIFGKISILAISSPIILALVETIYSFLN